MAFTAILGAGSIGGALAHKLAVRGRVREVRLIDPERRVAEGKALDILQSSASDGFSTRVSAADGIEAAAGAAVIVIADAASGDAEHSGEPGLAMLKRLFAMDTSAPVVFAGAAQRVLIGRAAAELHVNPHRLIGSAPGALESAVRALAALELDGSGTEVQVTIAGVPPRAAVIGWESATASGQPIGSLVAPHRLAAISARLATLWPPGPFALSSAAARVVEAVSHGSRRRYSCFVVLDEAPSRGVVAALPAELGPRGIVRVLRPALSRQEQTVLENGLAL
jgi:malate dehydrogenase